jgi:hypothetical protein
MCGDSGIDERQMVCTSPQHFEADACDSQVVSDRNVRVIDKINVTPCAMQSP